MAELLQRSLGPAWAIETRFPLNVSAVDADLNQLEMALLNLVVNARDAMPDGETVTIQTRERVVAEGEVGTLAPGRYVGLSVAHTGIGMDADTLSRALEPFFTTKGVRKGTGLGLSMVHGIAEQLHGTFEMTSTPGAGTKTEILLPVASAEPKAAPLMPSAPESTESGPLTILAVDDDAIILTNTAALLEDMGHHVLEATSGAEAIDLFRSNPASDLVITHFAMPVMAGAELAEQITSERPGTPIVLATGYGEIETDDRGAVRRLGKPFSQNDLRRAVADAVADGTTAGS